MNGARNMKSWLQLFEKPIAPEKRNACILQLVNVMIEVESRL